MAAPVIVIADLIADLSMHIPAFPVQATDLQRVTYLQLGPGGSCNTAIMAARLGLDVMCLGELGYDAFGEAVLEGLQSEGIDCGHIVVSPAVRTPVAGVVVGEVDQAELALARWLSERIAPKPALARAERP